MAYEQKKNAPFALTKPSNDENPLFPVFLKLEQLRTLIVGGGAVGLEKLTAILRNSPKAAIELVAPVVNEEILAFTERHPNLLIRQREFQASDLEGKDIVLVATDDPALNKEVRDQAKARKILTNVADTPVICDFYLGSIVQKGSLKLAISTNGKSPTVAKRVKEVLNDTFPDETEQLLANLTRIRARLTGDFAEKVKQLDKITNRLVEKEESKKNSTLRSALAIGGLSLVAVAVNHFIKKR
ncbi:bifunctional precorrin-2 dehydrogenase/sirohydrochlorin ferrochelatase [Pontibacter sp. SGAir0037]|uniref:precorrin-2 dehydrogenase/sirohydrochlorin ferrochelatase family protein n=1 Tax=Pontibacter sp. SGAir0037 TaxID=2571030 RepID=UPI0010CD0FE1|nr:siroheme synthase [Pontibacter sp. SGAir0037]